MELEWLMWRQLCKQLAKLGVDVNKEDGLICAVRLWGEELVALREARPEHTQKALTEARNAYKPHVLDGGAP